MILANGRNFTTLGLARWGTRPMVVAFNDSEVFFAPFVGLEAKLE